MSKYPKNKSFVFSADTIDECLYMAKTCLSTEKGICSQSVYGMAAVILLTSAIDIMGTYFENGVFKPKRLNKIGKTENVRSHFEAFYDILMDEKDKSILQDKSTFVSIVYEGMRCKSVHNGQLMARVYLINQKNDKSWIEHKKKTTKYESYKIYLPELLKIVENAFHILKEKLNTKNIGITDDNHPSSSTGLTKCNSSKYE